MFMLNNPFTQWCSTIYDKRLTLFKYGTEMKELTNHNIIYFRFSQDPPPIPVVTFDEAVYVVDEGGTVMVNILRGDDGGIMPINVGKWITRP